MTLSGPEAERIALDRVVPLLRSEGYEVISEPGPADLPPFLADRRPDAIAIGKHPCLLVEVFRKEGNRELTRIRELRSLLHGHDNWELRVFYFSSLEPTLAPVPNDAMTNAIQAARAVSITEPRAAILLAWSIVEAVARAYEAGLAIDFRGLFAGEGRRRISLPGYPFQRRRYWVRPRSPGTPSNA